MSKKENAQPRNAELSALKNSDNRTSINTAPFSARQSRVIRALMAAVDWIARESIDYISGASNGPEVIRQLRQRLGHDAIEMQLFDSIDRDGRPTKPGRYRLTPAGRQRLAEKGLA